MKLVCPHPLNFWIWALILALRSGDGFWKCSHPQHQTVGCPQAPRLRHFEILTNSPPGENPKASEGYRNDP